MNIENLTENIHMKLIRDLDYEQRESMQISSNKFKILISWNKFLGSKTGSEEISHDNSTEGVEWLVSFHEHGFAGVRYDKTDINYRPRYAIQVPAYQEALHVKQVGIYK